MVGLGISEPQKSVSLPPGGAQVLEIGLVPLPKMGLLGWLSWLVGIENQMEFVEIMYDMYETYMKSP